MDDNVIGTASVKITADISPLQQEIQKAKEATESLKSVGDNFKVTWMGEGAGSIQDYNNYLEQANKEWQEYEQIQKNIAQSAEVVTERIQSTTQAIQEEANTTQESAGVFERMKDRAVQVGDAIEGSWRRATDSINESSRLARTALIGLAAAVTAYGKSAIDEYAKYNQNAADTQAQLEKATTRLKLTIGQLLQPVAQAVSGIMDWVSRNKEIVAGVGTAIAVIAGSAGLIAVIKKLSGAFVALKATAGGIVGILSLIAGVAVSIGMSASGGFEEYNETLEESKKRTEELNQAQKEYNTSISDMNQQIADAMKGIEEANRSYRQSLKKILVSHEETVDKLTQQIKDANNEYKRALNERNAEFALDTQKEEELHADKVKELTNQINFLQRYNNKYNKEKLAQLKFALEEENNRHKRQTQLLKDELDIQNANEKKKLDERVAEYQNELDKEVEFLRKHRETLEGVRDEILEDEVEALTRQHQATLEGYQKAIEDARQKGAEAGYKWAEAFNKAMGDSRTVDYVYNGIKGTLDKATFKVGQAISPSGEAFQGQVIDASSLGRLLFAQEGYASGGYTGQGASNEVAGIVHKGEYVLPQEQVDQTTGTPKAMGNTYNINVSGVFATSALERRKVANDIMRAINQTNNARLGAY